MAGPFKLDNQYANYEGHWLANTAYATGKRVIAESTNAGDARKYVFEATTGGTSQDPGPPTWDVTSGNTTSDGTVTWTCREATTWANAHGKLEWLAEQVVAAGEIIHMDDAHSEDMGPGNPTILFAGIEGNPVKVIAVDKATDNAVSNYNNGINNFYTTEAATYIDGEVFFWGVFFKMGDFIIDNFKTVTLEKSCVEIASGRKIKTRNDNSYLKLIETDINFLSSTCCFELTNPSMLLWYGGNLAGDVNNLIVCGGEGPRVKLIGIDISSMIGGTIFSIDETDEGMYLYIKGIKLNATPPALITAGISPERGSEIIMDIADNGNTVYKFRREYQYGYAQDETTKVITGKAKYDGTNESTVKMVSRATPTPTFYDPWRYHLTTLRETGFAANRTYTVHIAQDHASVQPDALENDEIWLEVVYPDDSTAKFNITNDKIATPTTAPAAQTTSTESWEGLAATTRLQELAVTIASADGKNGPVEIWVCLAKESKTVYVCPEVYIS